MSAYFVIPVDQTRGEFRSKLEALKSKQEKLNELCQEHRDLVEGCQSLRRLCDEIQEDINRDIAKLEMEMGGFVSIEGMTIQ